MRYWTEYEKSERDGKNNYVCELGIFLKADDPSSELWKIVKENEPDCMETILYGKNEFFMIGERQPEYLIKIIVENMKKDAESDNIVLGASYAIRDKGESIEEFAHRVQGCCQMP